MPLKFLPPSKNFLGLPTPKNPTAVVIPFGLEKSVSYGRGTRSGPTAILSASHELELFDEEFWCEPCQEYGVATLPPSGLPKKIPDALDQLKKIVTTVLVAEKFPLVLGGEHSLTPGAVAAVTAKFGEIAVLHFDAHADLRDGYLGEKFSHAAALRRTLDNPRVTKLVSVGIRNISAEEIPFLEANPQRIEIFWAWKKARWQADEIVRALPKNLPVYLTFDLDAFDASMLPATGTPEPGGLFWDEVLKILRAVAVTRKIVAADVVELAPIKNFHASDFTAAKLVYKILNYALVRLPRNLL